MPRALAWLEDLVLDEVEQVTIPSWALREVTDDPRYSAIALARG